jgi:hypothetical protein
MIANKKRNDGYLDLTGLVENEFATFEDPQHTTRMMEVKESRLAHLRKEIDVDRGARLMLGDLRVLRSKTTDGLFVAKVVAQSVACMPSKDLEDGNTAIDGKEVVIPKIAKGTKAGPALVKLLIGMLKKASGEDLKCLVNQHGRTLLKEGAESLSALLARHEANWNTLNSVHTKVETDDEEDIRRRYPKKDSNKSYYNASGEYIYHQN